MSKKRAAQRSYAEWDKLVDAWQASGQRQGEFAEARGINAKTFQGHVWRSRKRRGLSLKGSGAVSPFVEVAPPSRVDPAGRGDCRITMSNTQIEFSSSSDVAFITEILSTLGYGK